MSERLHVFDEPATPEVDRLLRDFFRSEMPGTWPKAPPPRAQARRLAPWWRSPARLSLAASLLLGLSGYVALNGLFPSEEPAALQTHGGMIGFRGQRVPGRILPLEVAPGALVEEHVTPGGGKAELRLSNQDDGGVVIEVIEIPSTPSPR